MSARDTPEISRQVPPFVATADTSIETDNKEEDERRRAAVAGSVFMLVDGFFQLRAQRAFAVIGVEKFPDREHQPAATLRVSRG